MIFVDISFEIDIKIWRDTCTLNMFLWQLIWYQRKIGRLTKNSSNPMYIKINDWLFTRLFNQKYLNHIMKYWNIFVVRIHTCTSLKNKLYWKVFINPVQLLKKRFFFFFFGDIKRWFLFVLKHTPYWRFVKHNKSISKKKN